MNIRMLLVVDFAVNSPLSSWTVKSREAVFNPQITGLDRTTVRPGDNLQLSGAGFDPARQHQIVFQQNGKQTMLQTKPVSPNGTFITNVQIPTAASLGPAFMIACITSPGQAAGPCSLPQEITVSP